MKNFINLWCLILWINLANAGSIRYCIPKIILNNSRGLKNACNKLFEAQHEIQCIITVDRLTCFNLLSVGKADFMVAEPEDLRVMSSYKATNIVVTHQLKKFAKLLPQRRVEMVAIVKSGSESSWTTKGKKLCYLGLETHHATRYDYYYTPYFESWLFPRNCDSKKTLLENRIMSLSQHFDSACIAGPWSLDYTIDAELKAKYKNLCALCSNPLICNEDDRYYGMNGALMCLRHGIGDVAWLSRSDASYHFSQLASDGYSLLCPDGAFASLSDSNVNGTCTWIVDPRPVIIANKAVANVVLDKVTDRDDKGKIFYEVIHASYKFSYLHKLKKPEYIRNYLQKFPGYFSATVKAQSICGISRNIRWCVSSKLEARKCRSLQQVANSLELSPSFSCVNMQSRDKCIEAVSSGKCDVFVGKPSEASKAKKFGIKSIIDIMAHQEDESNKVAAIVRRNSRFNSYADLNGTTACFTGYRSPGWNAFVSILNNNTGAINCTDVKTISAFFKNSCVLGLDKNNKKFPGNLYSLCKNDDHKLGVEEKTFKCLMDGADVAFVNISAAKIYSSRTSIFNLEYKILCPAVEQTRKNCFLAEIILGSILVRENITKVKEDDIYAMFLALDRYFGRKFDRETPMFRMYEPYEDVPNVIFPNATVKFQRTVHGLKIDKYNENENLGALEDALCQASRNYVNSCSRVFIIFISLMFNILYTINNV